MEAQREKGGHRNLRKCIKGDGKQKALVWQVKLWRSQHPELRRSGLQDFNSAGTRWSHSLR